MRLYVPSDSPAGTYDATMIDLRSTGTETGLELDADAGNIAAIIRDSVIEGPTNSILSSGSAAEVAMTQLKGGAVAGTGYSCAAIFDESHTFYPDSCP